MSSGPRACLLACAACLLLGLASGCGAAPSPARKHAGPPPVVPGPSFAAPAGYRTGRSPTAIAIGDLSGDGRRDLVTANSATVSVLLNRGDGTFGARRDLPGGGDAVAIADLNGDGRRDVVVVRARGGFVDCRHCGAVSVLLNRGGGLLRPGREYETGADPLAVAVGDLDGDGTPDLAVANGGGRLPNDVRENWATGTVSILRGRGDGTFLARRDYAAGDSPMSLALADVNGDSRLDLATASTEGSSSVLLNRGDGTFRAGRGYDSTTGPTWVVAADLDGNGSRELAVASNDWSDEVEESGVTLQPAHVYTLANRGNGGFGRGRDLLQTFGYADDIESLAAGDLNGDRRPDLVVGRDQTNYDDGFVSVLLNDRAGGFRQRLDYPVGRTEDLVGLALALGDLNGDGRADLVTAESSTHEVTVRLSRQGLCDVQDLTGKTVSVGSGYEAPRLPAARRTIAASHCRVGTIRRARSDAGWAKGRVIGQKPAFGSVLPAGAGIDLVVSRGAGA